MEFTKLGWLQHEMWKLTNRLVSQEISHMTFREEQDKLFYIAKGMEKSLEDKISDGIVHVDTINFTISYKGHINHYQKKIVQIVAYFIKHRGQVITREQLMKDVWGDDVIVDDRTIDVHITKIRKYLFKDCISTIHGIGYKWNHISLN